MVPAGLPLLNFSPWTGWLIFDEFDLLLLGAVAGGYGRLSLVPRTHAKLQIPVYFWVLVALLGGTGLIALYRGIADAGGISLNWFAGYTESMNSIRLFKSLAFALIFVPLLQHELAQSPISASHRLTGGIVAGLAVVSLAVIWERAAFPGIFDFSKHYRTVALFWEMHVGGGAIDAYLAMATPFVVRVLISTRRPAVWAGAASLALLTGYACLTTYSRGVYFAVAGSLILLGLLLWAQKSDFRGSKFLGHAFGQNRFLGWRPRAGLALVLALLIEIAAVLGGGSFMSERLVSADRDLGNRFEHWRRGLAVLDGPADWLLGKGFGRFPASYAANTPRGEFSGSAQFNEEIDIHGSKNGFVTLHGPASNGYLASLFALTQRVNSRIENPYLVELKVRVQKPTIVYMELCERHLLYDGRCQTGTLRVLPGTTSWQTFRLVLAQTATANTATRWHAPRLQMLSISIANAGGHADFDDIRLTGWEQQELLENGQFTRGLANWFPAAQFYFNPWHADNLFLEILIERGMATLLVFIVLMSCAFWTLAISDARLLSLSPYLAASLFAALLAGLVSSFMDVPRIAFLCYVLTLYSLLSRRSLN